MSGLVCPDCSNGHRNCECNNGISISREETCDQCGGKGQVMDVEINSGTPYMYDCTKCVDTNARSES